MLSRHLRSQVHHYSLKDGLLYYSTSEADESRIVVPDDEYLKHSIMFEFHDVRTAGHLGRENTYLSLSRVFYWPHQYKWVRKYVRTCEICQRVKPSSPLQAPLQLLPVATECCKYISMNFVFGFPPDSERRTGILVFVDRFSKMVHLMLSHLTSRLLNQRVCLSTPYSAYTECRMRSSRIGIRGSQRASGRKRSRCLARG